jgi:hypothetical protein
MPWDGGVFFLFGKTSLILSNFDHFYKYSSMFKISHLGVSNFDFLSLCIFRTNKHNAVPILSLISKLKSRYLGNGVVLESVIKLVL